MEQIKETKQQKEDRIIVDILFRDYNKIYDSIREYIEEEELDY